jgi:hypothetical protein
VVIVQPTQQFLLKVPRVKHVSAAVNQLPVFINRKISTHLHVDGVVANAVLKCPGAHPDLQQVSLWLPVGVLHLWIHQPNHVLALGHVHVV